jgi:hypothetical protein
MTIRKAGNSLGQPKAGKFPRWLRYLFMVLGLISLGLLGFFWIRGVISDLDKTMTALFVILTAMFAFLAMPFLYRSEHVPSLEAQELATVSPVSNTTTHTHQEPDSSLQANMIPATSGSSMGNAPQETAMQVPRQPSDMKGPGVLQSAVPIPASPETTQAGELDRNELLEELTRCSVPIFNRVVFCSRVPESELPGETADRTTRAIRLIQWAETSGPGLNMLYDCYIRAGGRKRPAGETSSYAQPPKNSDTMTTREKLDRQSIAQETLSASNRPVNQPLPDTVRGCANEAQAYVNQAYATLNPAMNILPEDIVNASEFLKAAKGDIEHLKELLPGSSLLSEREKIIDQLRIITNQIDEYLLPHLKPSDVQDWQRKFAPILKALNELNALVPA